MHRADLKKWNVISYMYIEWVSCGILSEKVFILYSRTHEKLSVWRFFLDMKKLIFIRKTIIWGSDIFKRNGSLGKVL